MLNICTSAFFFFEFDSCHNSGLTFLHHIPGQFSGRLYFSRISFSFSGLICLPHYFNTISANFCVKLGPVLSSSDKPLARSSRKFCSCALGSFPRIFVISPSVFLPAVPTSFANSSSLSRAKMLIASGNFSQRCHLPLLLSENVSDSSSLSESLSCSGFHLVKTF